MVKKYTPYISYTKDGKPVANQKYVDPLRSTPGKIYLRKVQVTMKKNTAQARKLAFDKLSKRIDKRVGAESSSDITFHDLADKYLDFLNVSDKAWNTKSLTNFAVTQIKKRFDENIIADKINRTAVSEYLEYLLYKKEPKTLSNSSVRVYKSVLSSIFEYGITHDFVTDNPVKDVKVSWKNEVNKKREEIENKYLTQSELNAVLSYFKDTKHRYDYYLFFKVMASTGMRYSEAAGLKKENLIQKHGKWYFKVLGKQEYHYGDYAKKVGEETSKIKSDRTKTVGSYRNVLIPDNLALEVKENAAKHSEYLFINTYSKTELTYPTVEHALDMCQNDLEFKKTLTTHIFRHTYISNLASHGVPISVIMRQVGHQNSKITSDIYTHVTDKEIDSLHQSLNSMFDE